LFFRKGKSARVTAGRLVALIYLFCVLAPGAALALGTGSTPCFDNDFPAMPAAATHEHAEGTLHDHDGMHLHYHADAAGVPAGHDHDGKSLPGPCCALLCISAMPADVPVIAKPSSPISICAPDRYEIARGRAPPVLYRPPIV